MRWILVLLIAFMPALSVAADWYVRDGAIGSNDGSDWTDAWEDMSDISWGSITRGDTIYIADGTYVGDTFNQAASGTTVNTILKATEGDHGTEIGWSSAYGDGQAVWANMVITTPYWTIDGVTGGGPGSWKSGFGFKVLYTSGSGFDIGYLADDVTIKHVELNGSSTGGTAFKMTGTGSGGDPERPISNLTISYCYTDDLKFGLPFTMIPVEDFLAEYCYIGKFSGDVSNHTEIASIWGYVTGTITFRYNFFAYIFSTGGLMFDNHEDPTSQLRVYGNVFYPDPALSGSDNCCNGWVGGWASGGSESHNMRIYNNTFILLDQTGGSGVFTNFIVSANNDASNNLFYTVTATIDFNDIQTHDYNHYIASGGTHSEANGTSAASGDPFVDYVNFDFRLISPTIAGQTLSSPYNVDMLGKVRGEDGTWDRGAIEFKRRVMVIQ